MKIVRNWTITFFFWSRTKILKSLLNSNSTLFYRLQSVKKSSEHSFMCFEQMMEKSESSDFLQIITLKMKMVRNVTITFFFFVWRKFWNHFWIVIRPCFIDCNHLKNHPNTPLHVLRKWWKIKKGQKWSKLTQKLPKVEKFSKANFPPRKNSIFFFWLSKSL